MRKKGLGLRNVSFCSPVIYEASDNAAFCFFSRTVVMHFLSWRPHILKVNPRIHALDQHALIC